MNQLLFPLLRSRSTLARLLVLPAALALALAGCDEPAKKKTTVTWPQPVAGTLSSAGCTGSFSANDPLVPYQWYLKNTGDSFAQAFSSGGPTTVALNQDINLPTTPPTGCLVKVAVVDEGLEISHEDLSPNVVPGASVNFTLWPYGSNPTNPSPYGDHGTMVAGIIGMRAGNNLGGRGVAGEASLVGYNFLQAGTLQAELTSLGGAPYTADTAIFNQSYGGSDPAGPYALNSTEIAQYQYGVTSLRGGKGAIYVKAAGNGFDGYGSVNGWNCPFVPGLSCENANFDALNTLPYQIVVGAMNAKGVRSSYSTTGSALWVSAPGGEYGGSTPPIASGYSSETYMPAMVTTDQSGCLSGEAVNFFDTLNHYTINEFNLGPAGITVLNNSCNYTAAMNGTSSATPVVSGVAALLLQANPALTWRDVKHILAKTARKVDASRPAVTLLSTYVAEPAWITNSAGYNFHNWYGFGVVDVTNALVLAGTHPADSWGVLKDTNYLPGTVTGSPLAITDNNATGVTGTITVTAGATIPTFIEAVVVRITLSHQRGSDLGIELEGPNGTPKTRSVLLNAGNGWSGNLTLANTDFLTNAFYGEPAAGPWTLRVVDTVTGNTGTVTAWSIRFLGH